MKSRVRVIVVITAVLLALAQPAMAHVTIQPGEAEAGGFFKLTFRVPNERPDAGTVKLSVQFPEDHPFAFLNIKPVAGWKVTPERVDVEPFEVFGTEYTEAVRTITWEGNTINPGEFQEFEVSVGPLPTDVDMLLFPAVQSYSSGEEVRWVDADEEGERPAPRLHLIPAEDDEEAATEVEIEPASADDVDDAKSVGYIGIVVGAIGLLAGLGGIVTGRKRRAEA